MTGADPTSNIHVTEKGGALEVEKVPHVVDFVVADTEDESDETRCWEVDCSHGISALCAYEGGQLTIDQVADNSLSICGTDNEVDGIGESYTDCSLDGKP